MRLPLALTAIALTAACSCTAATPPTTTRPPAPRLIVWADSHGDEPHEWPTLIGCADKVDARIGWAIAEQGPISPPPLIDQIDKLSSGLRKGDRVVIALGANDLIDIEAPFADQVRDKIRDKIKARGATAIWVTLPPYAFNYEHLGQLAGPRRDMWNKWVRSLPAAQRLDVSKPLGDTLDPAEQIGDGIHLSTTAHRAIANSVRDICQ